MSPVPWSSFSKQELVEILRELENCNYTLAELWNDSDVHYVSECGCQPTELRLPDRVIEIRDRVVRRNSEPSIANPLRKWLSSSLRRRA